MMSLAEDKFDQSDLWLYLSESSIRDVFTLFVKDYI